MTEPSSLSTTVQLTQRILDSIYQRVVGAITEVETADHVAALTFDDGPDPSYTPRVLDVLQRHGARATFFMVGAGAHGRPDLVRRVAEAGHAMGNHSWDHRSFTTISGRRRRWQLRACHQALAPYGLRFFRPPYGRQIVASRLDAWLLGFQVITWRVHVEDWRDGDAERMACRLLDRIRPGSIILLHDAIFRAEPDQMVRYDRGPALQALTMFLEELRGRYRFLTVPELLAHGRPVVREWYADEW